MQGFRSEDGLSLPERFFSIHSTEGSYRPGPTIPHTNPYLQQEYNILWNYGARKLTKSSDKLPALSGIVEIYSKKKLNDHYLAGMWRKSLIEGLLWQGLEPAGVHQDRAPSWS